MKYKCINCRNKLDEKPNKNNPLSKYCSNCLVGFAIDGVKPKKLNGCGSNNGSEIDGREFEVETLEEFIELLKSEKQVHLNYFDGEDDLDMWVKTE